jgi:hypothetical protein
MKFCLPALAVLVLTACSEPPKPAEKKAKAPPPPSAPITGRQAFQMTYPPARAWANDCQPIRIRSLNLSDPKSEAGKAGAWEILYVAQSRGRQRVYTWSAIESEGNLHKGVFAGLEESWSGPQGQQKPFLPAALKIDTPEALETAIAKSPDYMKKTAPKPQVNFMLENTSRFPDPAWRVFWGDTISVAEWSVFIDATTGQYLGR